MTANLDTNVESFAHHAQWTSGSRSCFSPCSGSVEVHAAGQTIKLARGDFFGEMALLLAQPRQADVRAASYCLLLVLQDEDFQSCVIFSRSFDALSRPSRAHSAVQLIGNIDHAKVTLLALATAIGRARQSELILEVVR